MVCAEGAGAEVVEGGEPMLSKFFRAVLLSDSFEVAWLSVTTVFGCGLGTVSFPAAISLVSSLNGLKHSRN